MDVQYTLAELIARLTRRMSELETQARDALSDLSMRQIYYLETIHQLQHPNLTELATALDLSKPSVTNMVAQLVEMGYVRKVPSPVDGRVTHLHLTPKGERFTAMHDAMHEQIAALFSSALDAAEEQELVRLLNKIVQSFQGV